MAKAKFIGVIKNRNPFDRHAWEHTDLLYEYRGEQYIITKDNNGYMGTTLAQQHKEEQERIDDKLDNPQKPVAWKYEGSAEEGFDLFWKYAEGEEDEKI